MRSILTLLDMKIPVPDYSTLCRRAGQLDIKHNCKVATDPITLIVDSTGLKIKGNSEWCENKYGAKPRKTWRKLHIGIDLDSGDIVCSSLTFNNVSDSAALSELLDQVNHEVTHFIADGAYDGLPTNELLNSYFEGVDIIIPPPKDAILGADESRNLHIKSMVENGRMNWQKESGYNKRSIVEAQIGRYKKVIGAALKYKKIINQKIESKISVKVLNQMNALGQACYERTT